MTSLSNHILPVSATMVGVCMTVISLLQLVPKNSISPWADNILAVNALVFLASTMLSYWNIRHEEFAISTERWADRLFLIGLVVMVFDSFLVAFELFKD